MISTQAIQSSALGDDLSISHTNKLNLETQEQLDIDKTLSSGQSFRWTKNEDGSWLGSIEGNRYKLNQLSKDGNGSVIEYDTSSVDNNESKIKKFFDLDRRYSDIFDSFRDDPFLSRAMKAHAGLRVLTQDPWETIISFILSTASNIPRIKGNIERLCASYGTKRIDMFGKYNEFPTAKKLAAASEDDFKKLGFGYRAPYVLNSSIIIAEDNEFISSIRQMSYEDGKKKLCELPGVGEKVADCVLLFSFGFGESFPVDTWILKVLKKYYEADEAISAKKASEFGRQRFGKYAGVVQQFMFEYGRELNLK